MPDFDHEHYLSLPEAEAEAYLEQANGGPDDGQTAEGGDSPDGEDEEGDDLDDGEEQPAAPAAEAPVAPPAQPDQTLVPHGAMHEERMRRKALEDKVAELEAKLAAAANPAAIPEAPAAPAGAGANLLIEDPNAVRAVVQEVIDASPEMQELRALRAEKQRQVEIDGLAEKYEDPGAGTLIQQLEAAVPGVASMPTQMKYFLAKGIQAASPEAKAQATADAQAAGRQMTVEQKAKEMQARAGGSPDTPSLAGIPPAAANGPDVDVSKLTAKELLALPQDKLDALERNGGRLR